MMDNLKKERMRKMADNNLSENDSQESFQFSPITPKDEKFDVTQQQFNS